MYDGEFKSNARQGIGAFFDKEGKKRYEGEWKQNKGHGCGKMFDKNGNSLYCGEFENGKFEGVGKSFIQVNCPNCQCAFKGFSFIDYIGEFKNNAKNRKGRSYHPNGKMKLEESVSSNNGVLKKGFNMAVNRYGEIVDYAKLN